MVVQQEIDMDVDQMVVEFLVVVSILPSSNTMSIEYVTIASEGNAIDFGDFNKGMEEIS